METILTIPCNKLSDLSILLSYFLDSSPTGFAICVIRLINDGGFEQFIYVLEIAGNSTAARHLNVHVDAYFFFIFFPFCDYR